MKKLFYLSIVFIGLLICPTSFINAQGVGINSSGNPPDPSAILDASSTTKGTLITRMTTAQRDAITNPAQSLMIFNTTTNCLEIYINSVWQNIYCSCNPPAAPAASIQNSQQTQITWNWNTVSGALGYKYNTVNTYSTATDNGTSTSYTQTGLTCETAYTLYIWSYSSCGNSASMALNQTTSPCCIGTLISSFGTGGVVTENPSFDNMISAITIDATGVYVAGYDRAPGNQEWRIEKRNLSTGTVIWTQTSDPSSADYITAIAIDATGVYVAGRDGAGGGQWRIEKLDLSTGANIWTQTENPFPDDDEILAITVDATGLYVAGYEGTAGGKWRIQKRNLSNGSVIWTQTEDPSIGMDQVFAIAADATGLYIGGQDAVQGDWEWRIEKRDLNTGALISAFGTGGIVTENPSSNYDYIKAMTIDATGVYVAGYDGTAAGQWRIEKRDLSTGSVIWSQTEDPSPLSDIINALTIDATGVYLAGTDNPSSYEWRIQKRNLNTGSVIWTQTENPSGADDQIRGIAVDATGIYAAGFDNVIGNYEWRLEKRCK